MTSTTPAASCRSKGDLKVESRWIKPPKKCHQATTHLLKLYEEAVYAKVVIESEVQTAVVQLNSKA